MPTRLEDWQQRRQYLVTSVAALGRIHREAQVQILDHLLARHRDTPEAAEAARFPMRAGAHLDGRVAVVHHYLGAHAAVRAQVSAEIRAAVILGRIAQVHPQSHAERKPASVASWLLAQVETRSVYWSSGYLQNELLARIGRAVQASIPQDYVYLTVLDRLQAGPRIPDWAIMYMFERLDDPALSSASAAGLFVCCQNESVLDCAVLAWRDRLAANGPDSITRGLDQVFFQPHWRSKAADRFRGELAGSSPVVRIEALKIIEKLGGLDDVVLLLDLLALPPMRDEDPCERDAALQAARKLSGLDEKGVTVTVRTVPQAGAPATRYDDWLLRRRRLTHVSAVQHPHVQEHRASLDMILERCRGTPQAAQSARFAAPQQPFLHRRAVLVYHQLGKAEVAGVTTETEAGKRVSKILQRMATLDAQSSARTFAESGVIQGGAGPGSQDRSRPAGLTPPQLQAWQAIENEIAIRGYQAHVIKLYRDIDAALSLGSRLPEHAVYYLVQHLANPDVAELLGRCSNLSVLEYVMGAWRHRVLRKRRGPLQLMTFFRRPEWRESAADRFRRELVGGDSARVRLHAVRILGRIGSLDDVSLFSDLLCLPRWEHEDPRERPALLRAMRTVARTVAP
ncbi:MAG: hypothetical protein NTW87_22535 [Planctomycetota bacterium]|nr:hypothetical protein [Planctomycetota bacterium]